MTLVCGEDVLPAKNDEAKRNELIQKNEQAILKIASARCHRYITKSDDEWSVALYAFSTAIDRYDESKGSFEAFAGVSIEHALVDHYRHNKAALMEISLDEEGEYSEDELTDPGMERAALKSLRIQDINRYKEEERQRSLKEEIEEVNAILKKWGYSFYELVDYAPRQNRSMEACRLVLRYMLKHSELTQKALRDGQLPVRDILKATGVPKKIPERHRKYLLMALLVLDGDYPLLAQYLKFVRKEP